MKICRMLAVAVSMTCMAEGDAWFPFVISYAGADNASSVAHFLDAPAGVRAADPARVAAQIVSGIGFLGAGTIIMQKHVIHGLTTAAGMWVAAGIGMASAAGLYWVAVAATALCLVGLELFGRLNRVIRSRGEKEPENAG